MTSRPTIRRRMGKTFLDEHAPEGGEDFPDEPAPENGETPEDENDSTPEDAQDNSASGEVQETEETEETGETGETGETEKSGETEETGEKETDESNDGESDTVDVGELKIVLHLRDGRTSAGVWQPGADVHLETFMETDMSILLAELPGLLERAQARWNESPLRPKYEPPKKTKKAATKKTPTPKKTPTKNHEESAEQDAAGDGNPAGVGAAGGARATAGHGTTFLTQARKPAPPAGPWPGRDK